MRMKPPTVGSVQSYSWCVAGSVCPCWSGRRAGSSIAIVKITPPRMSKLRVARGFLTVGSSRAMTNSETIPIGMLT